MNESVPVSPAAGTKVKVPSAPRVMRPPRTVAAPVTGSTARSAWGLSGSASLSSTEPLATRPAWPAGRLRPENSAVPPTTAALSAWATGASDTPVMVTVTVAVACTPAPSAMA